MNIYDRVIRLERLQDVNRPRQPGLVFLSAHQSFEEAKACYESKHGYPLQRNAPIVNILTVDCSRPELVRGV